MAFHSTACHTPLAKIPASIHRWLGCGKAWLLLASACTLSGCGGSSDRTISSNSVTTGQVFATFQIVSDGSAEVSIEAQLTKDVPPSQANDDDLFISLDREDELWLSTGERIDEVDLGNDLFGDLDDLSRTQVKLEQAKIVQYSFLEIFINTRGKWYSANLPKNEDGNYRVSLLREDGIDAAQSTVEMPADFSISSPSAGEIYSRSLDQLQINWSPVAVNTTIEVGVTTTCQNGASEQFDATLTSDTGTYTISAGELSKTTLSGNCTSSLNLRKVKLGNFDPAFTGGIVTAYQTRRVVLTTMD